MDKIIAELSSWLSGPLIYGTIALVTMTGFIKCIYPVFRNGVLLNRAVMRLERSAVGNDRYVWQEVRFLGRSLRTDWQRFLLNARQLDLRGMPCNTEDYINEDTVVYKPGHAQLAELIPSLLTSLGILGTFIGLMQGLTGLDLSDAAKTIAGIPNLLNGMRFAFATSVAGIACSLTFNITHRVVVGRTFKALDSFDEAFYELAMSRPLDNDVQMICKRQDDEVTRQQTAEHMSGRIAGAVEVAVSRSIHPLTMLIDNFIQGTSREQAAGVQRIVEQFIRQIEATALDPLYDREERSNALMAELLDVLCLLKEKLPPTTPDDAVPPEGSSELAASGMAKETALPTDKPKKEGTVVFRPPVQSPIKKTGGC